MKLNENKFKQTQKQKKKEGFIDFVLFNPQSFNILISMSFVMATIVCGFLVWLFWKIEAHFPMFIFIMLFFVSIYNLYKNRHIFKAWNKKSPEFIDFTVADTLNSLSNKKYDKDKEEEEKWQF